MLKFQPFEGPELGKSHITGGEYDPEWGLAIPRTFRPVRPKALLNHYVSGPVWPVLTGGWEYLISEYFQKWRNTGRKVGSFGLPSKLAKTVQTSSMTFWNSQNGLESLSGRYRSPCSRHIGARVSLQSTSWKSFEDSRKECADRKFL